MIAQPRCRSRCTSAVASASARSATMRMERGDGWADEVPSSQGGVWPAAHSWCASPTATIAALKRMGPSNWFRSTSAVTVNARRGPKEVPNSVEALAASPRVTPACVMKAPIR